MTRTDAARTAGLAAVLAAAVGAAYRNSFSGPFVFDDLASIPLNPSIRRLWPPFSAWVPPAGGATVSGRPVLNFSFALNHAFGGFDVRGYHAVNLLVHVLAAWALFGVARRTLARTALGTPPERARFLGFAVALLWALHPLLTASVTYIVQRAEALMGLFYLLTLYCFIRGSESERKSRLWFGASWGACLLGMATKEVMVTAPLIVLLYDRTFLAGSFARAMRQRAAVYVGLFATWLPLAGFVRLAGSRGDTAGLGLGWTASAVYARAQFAAIMHYLRLAVWPHPLVFDYGTDWAHSGDGWLWPAAGVAGLAACTLYGLRRRPAAGFLGASFLLILAPSSSIIPIGTEQLAEHRMDLPLAAVVAAVVCAVAAALPSRWRDGPRFLAWALLAGAAAGLGSLTFARNRVYRSELSLWRDTVIQRPGNYTARNNLALALDAAGDLPAAEAEYTAAVRLAPDDAKVRNNFGRLLMKIGRSADAAAEFRAAVRIDPNNAEAHNDFGVTLALGGRMAEAQAQFERAVELKPDYSEARANLGRALRQAHSTN